MDWPDNPEVAEKVRQIRWKLKEKAIAATRHELEEAFVERFQWAGETSEDLDNILEEIEQGMWEVNG